MPNAMSPAAEGDDCFDLTTFFLGRTRAWGVFEDRFGKLRRRFTVEMRGRWENDTFLLEERFCYDTGDEESRLWRLTRQVDGRFTASSDDCVGTLCGVASPDAVRMTYRFKLRFERRSVTVDFADRIYRMGETMAVNRATMSKWGVKLGEISLFFERVEDEATVERGVVLT